MYIYIYSIYIYIQYISVYVYIYIDKTKKAVRDAILCFPQLHWCSPAIGGENTTGPRCPGCPAIGVGHLPSEVANLSVHQWLMVHEEGL